MNGKIPLHAGIPALYQLDHLFSNEMDCRRFLIERGVIQMKERCPSCNKPYSPRSYNAGLGFIQ